MAKKRSCRRTADENRIHDLAVRWRKMTDEQLVHYVEDRVAKAESEGYNRGKKETPVSKGASVEDFISEIANIKGIGAATVHKIKEHFRAKAQ